MAAKRARIKRIRKPNDAPIAAVVVTVNRDLGNTHAGVLYRDDDDNILILHLAFHHDLVSQDFDPDYLCVDPGLEAEDAEAIGAHCRLIADDNPTISFAIHYNPSATFSRASGRMLLLREGKGLNCSTFVLTVFQDAGIPLITRNGWPKRREDVGWHKFLVKLLRKRAPKEYVKRVAKDVGCARVRPEEVAGACLEPNWPAAFDQCEPNGRLVLTALQRHTGISPRTSW